MRTVHLIALPLAVLAACGGGYSSSGGGAPGGGGYGSGGGTQPVSPDTLTIAGMAYSPANLTVRPGATVTVVNQDSMPHSVTSTATPGGFTPGGVNGVSFDTGPFTGTRTFTLPADAPDGTVIPYYCSVHLQAMATPHGTITVSATAP